MKQMSIITGNNDASRRASQQASKPASKLSLMGSLFFLNGYVSLSVFFAFFKYLSFVFSRLDCVFLLHSDCLRICAILKGIGLFFSCVRTLNSSKIYLLSYDNMRAKYDLSRRLTT